MIKSTALATMVLIAAAIPAFGQGDKPAPAPKGGPRPAIMGQTGTMYDGNNANLQLPPEQNAYWARLWAQPLRAAQTDAQQ